MINIKYIFTLLKLNLLQAQTQILREIIYISIIKIFSIFKIYASQIHGTFHRFKSLVRSLIISFISIDENNFGAI